MKVLYFHPVGTSINVGDDITYLGSIELIKAAIGAHEIINYFAELESEYNEYLALQAVSQADLIVLSGTPWLWDMCHVSEKYNILKRILSFSNKPKIALGIGSSYPLNHYPITLPQIKDIWNMFNFISTRDPIASAALTDAGVESYNSFCTSAYAPIYNEAQWHLDTRPTVVYYDISTGIAKDVVRPWMQKAYNKFLLKVISQYNAKVITITEAEQETLSNIGIESFTPKTPQEVAVSLIGSQFVLSGRIHTAIPSAMQGIPTYIMPVDSRWLTTIPFGILPIFKENYSSDPRFASVTKPNLREQVVNEKEKIVSLITKALDKRLPL